MKTKLLILFVIFTISVISCEPNDKWINPDDTNADFEEIQKICDNYEAECGPLSVTYKNVWLELDCGDCPDGMKCNSYYNSCETDY